MTVRVPLEQKRRPRRELGDVLSFVLHCPLCMQDSWGGPNCRIVAYRRRSVRLECRQCGLRFSVDWFELARKLLVDGAPGWGDQSEAVGERQGWQALEAGVRGSGRDWDAFLEGLEALTDNDATVDVGGGQP